MLVLYLLTSFTIQDLVGGMGEHVGETKPLLQSITINFNLKEKEKKTSPTL